MLLSVLKDLFGNHTALTETEVLRVARELNNASRHKEAIKVLARFLKRNNDCVDALVLCGSTKRLVGQASDGMADLRRALTLAPNNVSCLFQLAANSYLLGDKSSAFDYCERTLKIDPGFSRSRWLQSEILLGDQHYYSVLERIHAHVRPRTYVEIGVCKGESLRLAKPPTNAIGIDPKPELDEPVAANQRLFTKTSDAFFASHDLRTELGGLPVDLAFIDGMHHFEFALRDFANLERYCDPKSAILIHNAYPLDRQTAERGGLPPLRPDGFAPFWSGDIWRLIVLLKKYRPDLTLHTLSVAPTGLALVRNLDPHSKFLADNHIRLCKEFLALDYAYLNQDKAGKLNLMPFDWPKIQRLLD